MIKHYFEFLTADEPTNKGISLESVIDEAKAQGNGIRPYTQRRAKTPGVVLVSDGGGVYLAPSGGVTAKGRVCYLKGFGPRASKLKQREFFGADDCAIFIAIPVELTSDNVFGLELTVTHSGGSIITAWNWQSF